VGVWSLPVSGWTRDSGISLDALAARYLQAGARHVLCTDIARDGTMEGFNLALYRDLHASHPGFEILASGGARSLDDIRAARQAGVAGVVLGRALLEGSVSIEDALEC
jgi:phosphoribosylformimino-5-aminoimidazole carboxamide ribotide isomerase